MNFLCRRSVFFLFCVIFNFAAFAKATKASDARSGTPEAALPDIPGFEQINQSVFSDDGEWRFVVTRKAGADGEKLYALNTTRAQNPALIYEPPAGQAAEFSNLCFLSENQTLYFGIHNGKTFVNGVQIFEDEGIYVLKRDSGGIYSARELRRFAKMEPWLVERAAKAYLYNPTEPDYSGFLGYLFSFADFDANPVFVYGNLTDEAALRFLYESSALQEILSAKKDVYYSAFEEYLFCRDDEGKPTDKKAITANHCPLFYRDGGMFANYLYFVPYRGHVYMLESQGSDKNGEWSLDFSRVYELFDSGDDFSVHQNGGFAALKAEIFETPIPQRADTAPLFVWNNALALRDANHSDFYVLKPDGTFAKSSINNIMSGGKNQRLIIIFCILLSFIILFIMLIFKLAFKNSASQKVIFRHEQTVRNAISADIHDSVVQDIRAVRLDVERLKVQEESRTLQEQAVRHLTECIKKMRDICYALTPAEIAVAETEAANGKGSAVDILSVIQTLCRQFSERTSIPASISLQEGLSSCFLEKEKSQYIMRIVAEILSNVEKHSYASNLTVLGRQEDGGNQLTLFFIDDGAGCDLKAVSERENIKNHFGMRNMRQYARLCDAKIDFLSAPHDGMQVKLCVKVQDTQK